MDETPTYSCVLAFDTNDPMFTYGFELGALWVDLEQNPHEPIEQTLHTRNTEMCMRIAESLDLEHEAEIHDETWMTVRYKPHTT